MCTYMPYMVKYYFFIILIYIMFIVSEIWCKTSPCHSVN